MQSDPIKKIHDEVLFFCQRKGLFSKLENSLSISESERFSMLDIDRYGLDVLDAVHCLTDSGRTWRLIDEIDKQTTSGDIVIEAGIGTGILSFIASLKAERVYAFEVNHSIFNLANEIKQYLFDKKLIKDNIIFMEIDARDVELSIKADVFISENIYTGMFFEKQIQIVKALNKYFKKDCKIVPSGMESSFFLCESGLKKDIISNNLYIVSEMLCKPKYLSTGYVYDRIDFCSISSDGVTFNNRVSVESDGCLDSILICSDVLLLSNNKIGRYDTSFMNNDILLSLDKSFKVNKGDTLHVELTYLYGSGPKDAKLSIVKL